MAYSDYGGYAYRNGVRVEERSDCTIKPDGDTFGTPGSWPGFAMLAAGVPGGEVKKLIQYPHGHAVLGDGPIHVMLYKQSTLRVFRAGVELDTADLLESPTSEQIYEYEWNGKKRRDINTDHFRDNDIPCVLTVDGWRIEARWTHEDNYYQYVRVTQPDGVEWCGWSGYGVGAGLEDCGYGFSTQDREDNIREHFPEAMAA